MTERIHIEIDRDVCIGAGNCARLARGAFALDDEEMAIVLDPAQADLETLRRAERSCPTGAIAVRPEPAPT